MVVEELPFPFAPFVAMVSMQRRVYDLVEDLVVARPLEDQVEGQAVDFPVLPAVVLVASCLPVVVLVASCLPVVVLVVVLRLLKECSLFAFQVVEGLLAVDLEVSSLVHQVEGREAWLPLVAVLVDVVLLMDGLVVALAVVLQVYHQLGVVVVSCLVVVAKWMALLVL